MIAPLEGDYVGWLRDRLDAAMTDVYVCTELPADLADNLPVVQIVPVGGFDDGHIVAQPRIVTHCFAGKTYDARALALRVGTAYRALVGVVADGATMQSVSTSSSLTVNDYPNTAVREIVRVDEPRIKTTGT